MSRESSQALAVCGDLLAGAYATPGKLLPNKGWGRAALRRWRRIEPRLEPDDGFVAGDGERVGDEQGRSDTKQTGKRKIAGSLKGRGSWGSRDAENGEGEELEEQTRSVEYEVDRDARRSGKGELESQGPGRTAHQHTDPGNTAAIAEGEDAGEQTILRHGHGQTRVAQREERVEHVETADASAGHNGRGEDCTGKARATEVAWPALAQSPVEKLAEESPAKAMAASGRMRRWPR